MELVSTLTTALRALPQRLSAFLRREILSVFLPGLITLLGLAFAWQIATRKSDRAPGDILSSWGDIDFPSNGWVQLIIVVVLAYVTYGVGALSRQAVFWHMLSPHRRRSATRTGSSGGTEEEYLQEVFNVWCSLVEAFGDDPVDRVFRPHGLATIFENRKAQLQRMKRSAPTASEAIDGQASDAQALVCTRVASDTRIEFMYCKTWLSYHRSPVATEHFEYEINVLCALTVPFSVLFFVLGEYLALDIISGSRWIRFPIAAALTALLISLLIKGMTVVVRKLQKNENFDTIRNFFFHHWMLQGRTAPAPAVGPAQDPDSSQEVKSVAP